MVGNSLFHLDVFREILKLRVGIAQADNRRQFELLSSIFPLELHTFASGKEHNGWVIPEDWTVEKALIKQDGRTLFDGTVHPLAVVQNSPSMRGTFSKEELDRHIFTRPSVPDAYAFHFLNTYRPGNRHWGFCVPYRIWQTWGPGDYEVELVTSDRPGTMIVGEAHLAGQSEETIVFNAHTCHPCQFNDDLAGVAVILELFRWLKEQPRRFSYRAVLGPEHFGTVFYLDKLSRPERERLKLGLFAEMVGIDAPLVLQRSFTGAALIDRVATQVLRQHDPQLKTGDFRTIVGNDETVWEAPGIEIPFASLSRCFHPGYYAEYHTSRDDLELNHVSKLEETLEMLKRMVRVFEDDCTIERNFEGLVALSNPKYSLYIERPDATVTKTFSEEDQLLGRIQDVLPRYLDGSLTVFEIAERLKVPFAALRGYLGRFAEKGLIRLSPSKSLADYGRDGRQRGSK
jgi:aminopeptidase-like protein